MGPRDLSTDSSARLLIMFTVVVKMCVETGAGGVGGTPSAGGGGVGAIRSDDDQRVGTAIKQPNKRC